jgi:hypothetical protein
MAITINVYDAAGTRNLASEPSVALPGDAGACDILGPGAPAVHTETPDQMLSAGSPDPALVAEIETALRAARAAAVTDESPADAFNAGPAPL